MKKIVLLFVMAGLLVSCGVSKTERQAQKVFKGDWTLTHVNLPSALVDVALFDDADTKCFENSQWHFVPNNNTGSYELMGCEPGVRDFHWSVQENSGMGIYSFNLKPELEGQKARKVKTGYKLRLVSLDEGQMQWEQTVSYEGKPFTIQMSFTKNY